ncbi:MAG TPA: hypothetical protein VIB00_15770 [Pyrinomonadaceae bacterium]
MSRSKEWVEHEVGYFATSWLELLRERIGFGAGAAWEAATFLPGEVNQRVHENADGD